MALFRLFLGCSGLEFFRPPPWRCVLALSVLCLSGACSGANDVLPVGGGEPRPDFARVCEAKGHVVDNWGKAVCMEVERMAWEADPEQWRKDLTRAPSPPKIQVLPPERDPYAGPQDF